MKGVIARILVSFTVIAGLACGLCSPVAQASAVRAAVPAYMRTFLSVCAPSTYGTPCLSDYVDSPLSGTPARKATVEVAIYLHQLQVGAPNPPLDKAPRTLRMVIAGSYYATDAPATLIRSWTGPIRGRLVWKLSSLIPLPTRQGQQNIFYLSISIDGWPTLHTSTIRVAP